MRTHCGIRKSSFSFAILIIYLIIIITPFSKSLQINDLNHLSAVHTRNNNTSKIPKFVSNCHDSEEFLLVINVNSPRGGRRTKRQPIPPSSTVKLLIKSKWLNVLILPYVYAFFNLYHVTIKPHLKIFLTNVFKDMPLPGGRTFDGFISHVSDNVMSPKQRLESIRSSSVLFVLVSIHLIVECLICKNYPFVNKFLHFKELKLNYYDSQESQLANLLKAEFAFISNPSPILNFNTDININIFNTLLGSIFRTASTSHSNSGSVIIKLGAALSSPELVAQSPRSLSTFLPRSLSQSQLSTGTAIETISKPSKYNCIEINSTARKFHLGNGDYFLFFAKDLYFNKVNKSSQQNRNKNSKIIERESSFPNIKLQFKRIPIEVNESFVNIYKYFMSDNIGLSEKEILERYQILGFNDISLSSPYSLTKGIFQKVTTPYFLFQIVTQFIGFVDEGLLSPVLHLLTILANDFYETIIMLIQAKKYFPDRSSRLSFNNRTITVFRDGVWTSTLSMLLVPGDIVTLANDQLVPADCLLIDGGCLTDESALTGESVAQEKLSLFHYTQSKESSSSASSIDDDNLDFQKHKNLILFSGTKVIASTIVPMVNPHQQSSLHNNSISVKFIDSLHDKKNSSELICMVLRTGSSSTLGKIFNSMNSAKTDVSEAHMYLKNNRLLSSNVKLQSSSVAKEVLLTSSVIFMYAIALGIYSCFESLFSISKEKKEGNGMNDLINIVKISRIVARVLPSDLYSSVTFHFKHNANQLLKRNHVFLTKPEKLSSCGLVSTCVFDKTGTICTDSLSVQSILSKSETVTNPSVIQTNTEKILFENSGNFPSLTDLMLTCQSLALRRSNSDYNQENSEREYLNSSELSGKKVLGDPLEMAIWRRVMNDSTVAIAIAEQHPLSHSSSVKNKKSLFAKNLVNEVNNKTMSDLEYEIIQTFPFDVNLQRLSVIVQSKSPTVPLDDTEDPTSNIYLSCKGSPESIFNCLREDLKNNFTFSEMYFKTYNQLALEGNRVIAFASRHLGIIKSSDFNHRNRKFFEDSLEFKGFVCLSCPIREDSTSSIKELLNANINVKIVSGDSLATCCNIASAVGLFNNNENGNTIASLDSKVMVLKFVSHLDYLIALTGLNQIEFMKQYKSLASSPTLSKKKILVWTTIFGNIKYLYAGEKMPSSVKTVLDKCLSRNNLTKMSTKDISDRGYHAVTSGDVISKNFKKTFQFLNYNNNKKSKGNSSSSSSSKFVFPLAEIKYFKVFGRVDPQTKALIVSLLQRLKEVVLMCGDGFNDIAAIAKADVGLSLPLTDQRINRLKVEVSIVDAVLENEDIVESNENLILSEFTSLIPSIRPAVDLIRVGRLSHCIFTMNCVLAIVDSILSGFLFTVANIHMTPSPGQMLLLSNSQSLIDGSLLVIKPLTSLSPGGPLVTLFTPVMALLTLVSIYANIFASRIFAHYANSPEIQYHQTKKEILVNSANIMFPLLLAQYALLVIQNFPGRPFTESIMKSSGGMIVAIALALCYSLVCIYGLHIPGLGVFFVLYFLVSILYNEVMKYANTAYSNWSETRRR